MNAMRIQATNNLYFLSTISNTTNNLHCFSFTLQIQILAVACLKDLFAMIDILFFMHSAHIVCDVYTKVYFLIVAPDVGLSGKECPPGLKISKDQQGVKVESRNTSESESESEVTNAHDTRSTTSITLSKLRLILI